MSESRMNGIALFYTHRYMEVNHENLLKNVDTTGVELEQSKFFYIAVAV